jgi:hypothetical protein
MHSAAEELSQAGETPTKKRIAVPPITAYRISVKTTIDLADDLAATLKKRTAHEGISLRAAVHEALRLWLKNRPELAPPAPIPRDVALMSGLGLAPEVASLSWEQLRALSYERSA